MKTLHGAPEPLELQVLLDHGTGQKTASLGRSGGVGHLDGDDSAEGAGTGIVLAADQAHVLLSGDGAGALLVGGNGSDQGEVALLTILQNLLAGVFEVAGVVVTYAVAGVAARRGGGDVDVGPLGGSAVGVDHASVGT